MDNDEKESHCSLLVFNTNGHRLFLQPMAITACVHL